MRNVKYITLSLVLAAVALSSCSDSFLDHEMDERTTIDNVPQLIVRKEQEVYNNSIPTLTLIDGMPVYDVERLLSYDARRVHYINIYAGQYTFGNSLYNGILSFVTRSGQLTNYPTEPGMQYLVYDFPE